MIKKITIKAPIEPDIGFGEIKLGMNIFYFKEIFDQSKKYDSKTINDWTLRVSDKLLFFIFLGYKNTFELCFNCVNGKLSCIVFKEGYKGRLWGKIKVGCKVEDLIKVLGANDYSIYDGILTFEKNLNVWFVLDDTVCIKDEADIKMLKDIKVKEIRLINRSYGSYSSGMKEIPGNWKKSRFYDNFRDFQAK